MPDLRKSRVNAKTWVTRCGKDLVALCARPDVKITDLTNKLNDFRKKVENFDIAQEEYEMSLVREEELEADINIAADYKNDNVWPVLEIAQDCLSKLKSQEQSDNGSENGSTTHSHSGPRIANLPKIALPSFSGDILEWCSFWEQFCAVIHETDMPQVTKYAYLRSLLSGEAAASISGLSLTAASYTTACQILKDRFGRPTRIIFSHVQALLNVGVSDAPSVNELWSLYNTLQSHIRSLETLSITGSQYGVILTPIIVSRLPDSLRLEWAREGEQWESNQAAAGGDRLGAASLGGILGSGLGGGSSGSPSSPFDGLGNGGSGSGLGGGPGCITERSSTLLHSQAGLGGTATYQGVEADLDFLMNFLHREIQRRERSQTFVTPDPPVPTAAALHARSSKTKVKQIDCAFCNAKHSTAHCSLVSELSIEEKKQRLVKARTCWKCLLKVDAKNMSSLAP